MVAYIQSVVAVGEYGVLLLYIDANCNLMVRHKIYPISGVEGQQPNGVELVESYGQDEAVDCQIH